jgi:hypothetical protein
LTLADWAVRRSIVVLNASFLRKSQSFSLRFRKCGICAAKYKRLPVSPASADILESLDEGRRLRLRFWGALRRQLQGGLFSNKKGEWLNPLKFLNPKRQIQAVNRQELAIQRQKTLALLSFVCQCPDCSVTKSEDEYDG